MSFKLYMLQDQLDIVKLGRLDPSMLDPFKQNPYTQSLVPLY